MELPQEKAEASSEETGDDGSCDDNDNHHHNNGKNQGVKLANGGGNNHTVTAQQGAGEYTADFYEELEKQSILAGAYVVNPDRVSSEAADFIADVSCVLFTTVCVCVYVFVCVFVFKSSRYSRCLRCFFSGLESPIAVIFNMSVYLMFDPPKGN